MRLLKYALVVALLPVLWAQSPQIPVTGTLGAGGVFPLVNSPSVVFATDANHTMTYPEMSGSSGFLVVTSSTALTATRQLIAPLVKGFTWAIENATTGGYAIQVIGATGTGVTIANGYTLTVYCDGTNYVTLPSASGGTVLGVTATAPVASSGGTNPVISMAQATAIVNGWLSSADWSTFNGKQAALGYTPAHSGANSDITSLTGLTTPLPTSEGGTGGAGGTGYAYGNGSAAFSFSPTIPWSAITGGPSAAITTLTGDVAAGPGSGSQAATVQGLESVPFCTGFTPTNGQAVQYTTTSSPNPCYTAVTSITGVTASSPCTSTGGTNPNIACPTATSSQTGLLLSSDWSTFNGKQAALGYTPAHSGANSDITSLAGLTTPLPTSEGGTGGAGGTGYAYGNGSSPFSYSTTIPSSSLTIPMSCQPGLGDGLNAIPAGTYLQTTCRNETGQVWTLTVIRCVADSGSSTCNVTDSEGDPLLTGAITGTSTYASGTIGGTTIIGAGDYLEITFVTDGTTKQIGIDVAGTF